MTAKKEFRVKDVCKILNVTQWTLANWYQWEKLALSTGQLKVHILPIPQRKLNEPGKPRYWNEEQLKRLKKFQKSIVKGRNGVMGQVTNPASRRKKS